MEMAARGDKIYGHLPPGVAPAADAADGPTYLDCPYKDNGRASALGARWDSAARRWYAPPGLSLAPFREWRVRPSAGTSAGAGGAGEGSCCAVRPLDMLV